MATFQNFKDNALSYVVGLIVGMVWYDVREVKNDVKTLIIQTSESKAKIEALERSVYKPTSALSVPTPPYKLPLQVEMRNMMAVINKNDLTPKEYETLN